jgi:hypothetical protein
MEKIGFCFSRAAAVFFFLGAFALFDHGVWAQNRNVRVSVEVDIENDDVAAALEKARIQAFRQAIQDSMPQKISEEERSRRLRSPSQFVKSFQIIERREENKKLFALFECEVILAMATQEKDADLQSLFAFEFIWRPDRSEWSIEKLIQLLESDYSFKVESIRMNSQSWILEGRSTRQPNAIYASLGPRFQKDAEVHLKTDLHGIFEEQNEGL